jgi:hypothetical protein
MITAAVAAAALATPVFAADEGTSFAPPGYAPPPSGYRYVKNRNDDSWVLVLVSALAGAGLGYAIGNDNHHDTIIVPVSGQ